MNPVEIGNQILNKVADINLAIEQLTHLKNEINGLAWMLLTETQPAPPIADTLAGTSANTTDPVPVPDPIVVPPTSEDGELPDTE